MLGSVPKPDETSQFGVTSCVWEVNDDQRLAVSTGQVNIYQTAYDTSKGNQTGNVPGIGDEAFVVKGFTSATSGGTSGTTLWVIEGQQIWAISAELESGDVDQATLESIAKGVIAATS